jgi:hypothetical protein
LVIPALEICVVRHHFSEHDIQRILRSNSDKPGVVIQQPAGVLIEVDFPLRDDWLFRTSWHLLSPSSLLARL